ncbi:MAG: DUF2726 domain-containing protein [Desulfurobacteriaceae bacterium]
MKKANKNLSLFKTYQGGKDEAYSIHSNLCSYFSFIGCPSFSRKRKREEVYSKKAFLSGKEAATHSELVKELSPDFFVFPNVRMLDVIVPQNKKDFSSLGKISSKKIDFLITDSDYRPVAVLSKDERTKRICEEVGLIVSSNVKEIVSVLKAIRS